MSVLDLVRADLRDFTGYRSARSDRLDGSVWLNANESPWANPADADGTLRRYPEPQPQRLRAALAELYGVEPAQLLAGRGSDEGIDLLLRALCRPGSDAVVVTTPTFGMYAVCARLHGAEVVDVPLLEGEGGYACDFAAVGDAAERRAAKIVFLCSPGNPGGNLLPLDAIAALAQRLRDRCVVVVDEAYLEFAAAPSATGLLREFANVAVLRTLSKAHALAAARIGSVIADADLLAVLQRCQAPYPLPQPCVEAALAALAPAALARTRARIDETIRERSRLQAGLDALPAIRRVAPSTANFVQVRCHDPQAAFQALLGQGIVVRDLRAMPGLSDALRISIGTPEQNQRVLATIAALSVPAGAAA
ncbi:histidinol-phosphate transaminase [Lysobacter solisilvae (ex Woo and Kim 2020)]|uniref:Histidinol-phosphate aminotransferase n=1 Tax=Agrilutibacter terrestris TaxID=2865112 RepID=A0A7H0FWQ7_9GAMM|nr:histidinol-phosphate transaminase [Lysobacter terrestris]QNP40473.1 histidinol-phosphate transaminase [Lysobacter terrestris]